MSIAICRLMFVGWGAVRIQSYRGQHLPQRDGVTYWSVCGRAAARVDRSGTVTLERLLQRRLQNAVYGGFVHRESRVQHLGGRGEQSWWISLDTNWLLFPTSRCCYEQRPQSDRLATQIVSSVHWPNFRRRAHTELGQFVLSTLCFIE